MSSWINEAAAVPNHNGNGFAHMNDPNSMAGAGIMDPSAFMASAGQFASPGHPGQQQFANPQQMAAAMQNGQMRNASPSFANPVYQTNPVIPSKRPRPREDSISASPRQNPGMLPTSRADTPQQAQYPGYQPNAMQQQNPGQPQHYPHLKPNGSATASPSPVMAGNQLRPGSVPQRVNTASPHPFSPASQHFGPQASPVPSEHSGTPQPGMYMNAPNFPQGFHPNYAPSPSPARPPSAQNHLAPQMMPHPMGQMAQQMQQMPQMPQMHPNQMYTPQQMQHMQHMQQMQAAHAAQGHSTMDQQKIMMHQMRLQQQYSQANMPQMAAQLQAQNMAQSMAQGRAGMMPRQAMPMQNGQMPPGAMRPQQPAQVPRGTNPEGFLKNLITFMSMHKLPLDTNPIIEGRPLALLQLFQNVSKFKGYRAVTASNGWPQVAASVGFHPQQFPSAPNQVRAIYERNLLKFEEAWAMQQRSQQVKHQAGGSGGMPGGSSQGNPQRMGQMSPQQHGQPGQPHMQQQHVQTPVKQMAPGPGVQQANVNGFSTPNHPQMVQQQANAPSGHLRNSMSGSIEGTPASSDFPMRSPIPAGKPGSISVPHTQQQADSAQVNGASALPFPGPFATDPDVYVPCSRELHMSGHGGFDMDVMSRLGSELEKWRPDIPPPQELGNIDLHALTKSLQCGIHGEIRMALDTLASVTRTAEVAPNLVIDLRHCEDLVESLIDTAEEQVDLLAEKAEPVADEIDLTSYEEVVRACRGEQYILRKVPVFGDADYELERAADRLLAITTIMRNLSFYEPNQLVLADEVVTKFLCSVIRSLGTHENLLGTAQNALDFMKDVIVLLSNIAGCVEIPGREQALCLLQFLLAFAPSPAPNVTAEKLVFSPFEPSVHVYLPHAIDALAKLLARDEPNRTHYKIIFATDATASLPYELLTRTFAFAISPIPDQNKETRPANLPSFVEARKPLLMQGLLAADIIAQLAPGYETRVTRSWLTSSEGFAHNLFRLIYKLCTQAEPTPRQGGNARNQPREDVDVLYIVTCGISTLRRLSEKAKDPNDPASIPPNALPTRESLFRSLHSLRSPKWTQLLNQLSTYAGLDK
ncbi:Uu.00g146920.m01.CDS01 [Anthostomella pinea]|uniref:Uu.00g146920.m01.CDS01 n=1 Tax=Anthostomella pinea TaxID=933095 RepID=A0AAI8VRE2_9PEZI|nr:Uu.00g146920.m01.CDS01 [Anthostomella pinea]